MTASGCSFRLVKKQYTEFFSIFNEIFKTFKFYDSQDDSDVLEGHFIVTETE